MQFYSSTQPRPIRLSENTRAFAWESLHGKYGDDAMSHYTLTVDDIENYDALTPYGKYDACVQRIAEQAPVRIAEQEMICGAATLGLAIAHFVPVQRDGKNTFYSVSHLTPGFERVLRIGMNGIERELLAAMEQTAFTGLKREVQESMLRTIESMRIWHGRYLEAVKDVKPRVYDALLNVPFEPPRSFFEAVQSLWFTFAFMRVTGNWPGIGRIDDLLGRFLKHDLADGVLTMDEAREILAHFFIKGTEWTQSNTAPGPGDAHNYQNIVMAGMDADGNDITNEVTYLVLDVIEELGISDYPIAMRIGSKSPDRLVRRVAEVVRYGGGVVAAYNEDLVLDSMTAFGYEEREARRFANDGCWEVQVPGETYFSYIPFDALRILLDETLGLKDTPKYYDSMDALYAAYMSDLQNTVDAIYAKTIHDQIEDTSEKAFHNNPCSVVSLFTKGCAESGLSYFKGGPVYTVMSLHIGGAPDVGNSLYAIQKLVFDDQKVTFGDLMRILQDNWEGHEPLRLQALNRYTYYGNDDDAGDHYTVRVLDDFADMVSPLNGRCRIRFPAGVSTFGRQLEWSPSRAAVPFGRRKGDILSGNASPTPGTDLEGATAIIKSYCKADLKKQSCGAALDVKLHPSALSGEEGVDALAAILRGFVALGGFFMQPDVIDAAALEAARENPEAYKTLSVRVTGWNARFVTLNKRWQDMIIERTAHGL